MRFLSLFALLLVSTLVSAQTTVLTHLSVIDGTGSAPKENLTLVIQNGKIQALTAKPAGRLPKKAQVLDMSGKTAIPGLINAHGHLALVSGTKNSAEAYTKEAVIAELEQYEHYGVTSMVSLGLNRDLIYPLREAQRAGEIGGATVFVADRGIGVPDGAPPLAHQQDQLYQPKTPEEARQDVDEASRRHPDLLKIWVDSLYGAKPKMTPEVIEAVIEEAHKNHIPVAAHVYALADAKFLVRSGVDVIAHSVRNLPVDREFIQLLKQHGTYYLPTFTVDESFFVFADHPEFLKDPFLQRAASPELIAMLASKEYHDKVVSDPQTEKHRHDLLIARRNALTLLQSGVKVGFGTDSGAMPTRIPGYAEHRELELLVQAGFTPLQALHCATQVNAQLLGIDKETGTIEVGKNADLLIIDGNPLNDIRNTRKIVAIYHHGKTIKPAIAP